MGGTTSHVSGQDMVAVSDAFAKAFDQDELDAFLLAHFDVGLDEVAGPGPLTKRTLSAVRWADKRSIVPDLVRAAFADRPKDAALTALNARLGAAPDVSVQSGGRSQAQAPATAAGAAFEKIVRPQLALVDMDVWREKLAGVENRVCRVERAGQPAGTGFLVGPDLVVTNYHVLEAEIAAGAATGIQFRFDYKQLTDGSVNAGLAVDAAPGGWLVDWSRYSRAEQDEEPDRALPTEDELDFALVRLARPIGAETVSKTAEQRRGWIKMPDAQPPLAAGSPVIIAQHPMGAPLKLAVDTAGVLSLNANGTRVRYATNTDNGSSGSPCFDFDWTLVALHHMGDPAWRNPSYNEGVPIGRIAARPKVAAAARDGA